MTLRYDAPSDTLLIDDDLDKSQQYMYIALFCSLMVFMAPLYDRFAEAWRLTEYLRLFVCLCCLAMILYTGLGTTSAERIPTTKIKALSERPWFGRYVYSLQLVNGKRRPLQRISSATGRNQLFRVLEEAGVPFAPATED